VAIVTPTNSYKALNIEADMNAGDQDDLFWCVWCVVNGVNYLTPLPHDYVCKHGLPAEAVMGAYEGDLSDVDPRLFQQNTGFVDFLHSVIEQYCRDDPDLIQAAADKPNGSVVIVDQRVPDPNGDISPEDIVGIFEWQGGMIGEYHPCEEYRVFNKFGIMRLDPPLQERIVAELIARHE
jgi:hypothetical protein